MACYHHLEISSFYRGFQYFFQTGQVDIPKVIDLEPKLPYYVVPLGTALFLTFPSIANVLSIALDKTVC